jgi:dipeptidyl aminopeptidase/acylaminoacyl peptidase
LAWADHKESKPRVIMFDVPGGKVQRVMAVPENTKLRYLAWSDNQTLLIGVSATRMADVASETSQEVVRTIAQDVTGGEGRLLPNNQITSGSGRDEGNTPTGTRTVRARTDLPLANLVAARATKPNTVIMETYGRCRSVLVASCLLEVNTRTGTGTVVKVGSQFTGGWLVDRHGQPIVREDWNPNNHEFRLYALGANDTIKEIYRKEDTSEPKVAGLLPDGSAVVLLAANGRARQAAWALPLDGSAPTLIADDPDSDITGVYTDPYTGAIIGVYAAGTAEQIHWLDAGAEHRHEVLARSFPGREVDVFGWTADGTKTLARVETPSSPPIYYLIDFTTHRADIAAEEYPALAGVALASVKQITYQARDGTPIPAYLAIPAGNSGAAVPLVVLPHGGPQARDYFQFDWLVQFLASRGYAVLQPQFRGSTGFGEAFEQAGYRQWGGLMQDDVTDGVKAMIEQGVADPHRICIVGASYGGYAALAGAAFTPDLYSCAASISGVSDLQALMSEEVPYYGGWGGSQSVALSVFAARIGAPTDPNLAAKSPINYVKSIKIPILIIYGTGDGVVPNAQSQKMVNALKSAGKSVDVSVLPGEDHWLSRNDTRIQVLQQLDVFLRAHL